jgi:hypothetical protein
VSEVFRRFGSRVVPSYEERSFRKQLFRRRACKAVVSSRWDEAGPPAYAPPQQPPCSWLAYCLGKPDAAPTVEAMSFSLRVEDMAGTLDQNRLCRPRDAELRIPIARLTASGSQAEITTDITALSKALLASQREHERQSCKVADSVDLQQHLCPRILRLTELLDLTTVLLDLECHHRDLLKHWTEQIARDLAASLQGCAQQNTASKRPGIG